MKKCKNCGEPFEPKYSTFEKYCAKISCRKEQVKTTKPIPSKSEKRKVDEKVYLTLRKVYLESHPNCMARVSGCSQLSTDVHHKERRGVNYLKVTTWMAVCRNCHRFIEDNPEISRQNGWLRLK